jgi:hypothetical protein
MARAIHKHPKSCHIFVVPRLMTSRWRRRVGKLADMHLTLAPGFLHWKTQRHEPLLIYFCLPLSVHRPWKLRGSRLVAQVERQLRQVPETSEGRIRYLLCKFLIQARKLDTMPEGLVRGMLQRACVVPVPH